MDIKDTPFSYFKSYMSIVTEKDNDNIEDSLWLKSLRGKAKHQMKSIEIIPIVDGKKSSYRIHADYSKIDISVTNGGSITIAFESDKRIIIEGTNCDLKLDTHPKYNFEYNYLLSRNEQVYCIVNSYKNYTKYLVYPITGQMNLEQTLSIDSAGSMNDSTNESYIIIKQNKEGRFTVVLEDVPTNGAIPTEANVSIQQAIDSTKASFNRFCQNLPSIPEEFQETQKAAAYVLWSSTVKSEGNLKRTTVYSSNKNFPGAWSWDHCFIALGLAQINKELALDQMFTILDHQDDLGQLPGSVSDSSIRWNFSKPPVHGFFFQKLRPHLFFTEEQTKEIYTKLEKQVMFYLGYKDSNQDGICEYHHGNDSGQDNSTVFRKPVIIDSPDLTAFLIKEMEFLSEISRDLHNDEHAVYWENQAFELQERFNNYFLVNDLPTAKETLTGGEIHSHSLLPMVSIILGNRLPDKTIQLLLKRLSSPDYLTEWGVATESLNSSEYQEDAYWRGAIWGPTTLLIVEGLEDIGETLLAKEIAKKYCRLAKMSGFPENFNAKTGAPLRDKSFSWTAAVFLHLSTKIF
ncbi:amylo-alpha-1,6-glucosidase [Enterococcus sp. DIV0086]|uniref:amylo-alpha-1,6-glucosidase n=1 Tax=Enterococcus sp. DIV0086 TaxID=2774655 RepID=UPI003D2B29E7